MTQHSVDIRTILIYLPNVKLTDALLEDLRGKYERVIYRGQGEGEPSAQDLKDADIYFGLVVPKGMDKVEQVPNLTLFQAVSAGYSHIDSTDFFKNLPKDSPLMFSSSSGIHVSTIGEHVLATVLMLYHKLHTINLVLHNEKRWMQHSELGNNFIRELSTLEVGIIGYGHIGRETARLFKCCGSTILALNRNGEPSPESGYIIKNTGDPSGSIPSKYYSTSSKESTLQFFSDSDVVVNTLPDSEYTRGFVGKEQLKAMKGDAVYVNIGRGTTTDQEALIEALEAKPRDGEKEDETGSLRIGGASLDVTQPEPLPDNHPLFSMPNVILTPHMSGMSKLYFERAVDLLNVNIERIRSGKGVLNAFRGRGEDD